MKHILAILLFSFLAGLLACGDDPVGTHEIPPPPVFKDLSQKWHVLNNFEVAYNKRNIDRVSALLDQDFTFYLTDKDVQGGLPEAWDRVVEYTITRTMFSTEQPPNGAPRCKSVKLDIQWEDNLTWIELSAPIGDETWYKATLFVNFEIDVEPDIKFISNTGTRAEFVVRNAGTAEQPRWTLVEMIDLGAPSGPSAAAAAAATEPATWGHVKALFI